MTETQAAELLASLATIKEILSLLAGILVGGFCGSWLNRWVA